MENNFVLLTEKEEMWAQMLIEVLEDNGIPCTAMPVYGYALALKTGRCEVYRIFVPSDKLELAKDLVQKLFGHTENED